MDCGINQIDLRSNGTAVSIMSQLLGTYELRVDSKGRVKVPSALMEQLPKKHKRFVINCGFEKCLSMYTYKEWESISKRVNMLNDFKTKHRQFKRAFFRGATPLDVDSNGRVLIPKHLLEYAGIKNDVVLSSVSNKIEIWNKSQYGKVLKMDSDTFADLADEVFSDFDQKD